MTAVDVVVYSVHGPVTAAARTDSVRDVWAEVYGEPPFNKGPDDVATFLDGWPNRLRAPGFRLVLAELGDEPVGVIYGHRLRPGTPWWEGALDPLPEGVADERPGRTVVIVDMLVRAPWRRRGVSRQLHAHYLAGRDEERVTLLVRPDNDPARHAYEAWGYERLGRNQPFPPDGTVFDSMVRPVVP
ncbi:MAG: GNAT family N-acetyltransferase [Streptosporangiales bacterium]|nr:GNAT family N-acetyltransferase [Streptosporangiales bacterium]